MSGPRRFLALHLPRLATDRLRRAHPEFSREAPLATWMRQGASRLLEAVNEAAEAGGLHPGQAMADAQALLPELTLFPAAPAEEAASLEALALWARRYTPLVATRAPDGLAPDGLLLDISGCAHLFGGEAALMADARARLRRAGIASQGAVAGQPAAAAALARAQADGPLVAGGSEEKALARLPIAPALRLPEPMLLALAGLGLRQIGDLLRQPRGPLMRRFGAPLLDGLDAITGRRALPFTPVMPPPDLRVVRALLEPVVMRNGIEAVLDLLLEGLCGRLRRAGLGARRLSLTAWRVDGTVQQLAIGTGQPSREPAHLRRLFAEPLGTLAPDLGFERLALEAWASDAMAEGAQIGMGLAGGEAAGRAEALAQLCDRLGQRLQVRRLVPMESHWPERGVRAMLPHAVPALVEPSGGVREGPALSITVLQGVATAGLPPAGRPPAPVLLRRRPIPVEVTALLPNGPPAQMRWRGKVRRVLKAEGPLRLEPEWWRGGEAGSRDYHRIELPDCERLWLRKTNGEWVVQGHFP